MVYAGGPGKPGSVAGQKQDEVAMAGLDKAHVEQFESLGFERSKVVCSLTTVFSYLSTNNNNACSDRRATTTELSRGKCSQD